MIIKMKQLGKQIIVVINGDLDSEGDKQLSELLYNIRKLKNFEKVSFDMSVVKAATSSSIGMLLNFYKFLDSTERKMEINGISDSLYHQFKEIHLEAIFPIVQKNKTK